MSANGADHELSLPELLVVGNMIMSSLTLSNLVDGSVSLDIDLNVSELLGINLLELELQPLFWDFHGLQVYDLSLEFARAWKFNLRECKLTQD